MKPIYPQRVDNLTVPQPTTITVPRPQEDEILQEQMRRLHNARARQRSARRHLAAQTYI